MVAVSMWLKERFKLDVSPDKIRIINLKTIFEVLGFKFRLQKKGQKASSRSFLECK